MMRGTIRFRLTLALAAAALAAGTSCDDPIGPPDPVAGHLELRLVTPAGTEGALVLALTGPSLPAPAAITAPPGSIVFARAGGAAGGGSVRVAVFGELGNGVIARFPVADISNAGAYAASLVEVAGPDHALRDSLTGYVVTVTAAAD